MRKHRSDVGPHDLRLGGVFRSLGGFLELLSDLVAEAADGELHHAGELGDEKQGVRAVYGCSVRVGGGRKPLIGDLGGFPARGRGTIVEEASEPMVDVFDEDDHLLVIADLPGLEASDIGFEVKEDVLELSVAHGDRKYRKVVLLPAAVRARAATSSYRNGVLVLRLHKEG